MKSSLTVLAILRMTTGWTILIARKLVLATRMVSERMTRLASNTTEAGDGVPYGNAEIVL